MFLGCSLRSFWFGVVGGGFSWVSRAVFGGWRVLVGWGGFVIFCVFFSKYSIFFCGDGSSIEGFRVLELGEGFFLVSILGNRRFFVVR